MTLPPDADLRAAPLRLAMFYIASFAVLGVYLPYMPVWLEDRGCTAEDIGYVMSAAIWARVAAGPLSARWVDRTGRHRATLLLLSWGGLACFALFGFAQSVTALAFVSLGFGFLYPPINSLADSLTVAVDRHRPTDYGRVRLWGSLSFLLWAGITGAAWQASSPDVVYWLVLLGLLGCGVTAFVLPEVPSHARPDQRKPAAGRGPVRTLVTDGRFVLFLVTVGLIQASHAAFYAFSALHWEAAGISKTTIGILWAEGVVAEVVLFAVSAAVLARLRPTTLMAIGAAGACVRWVVTAESTSVPVMLGVQWTHALSFGCTHLAAVRYIARNVPAARSATAQSLMGAFSMGAAMALATMASGELYDEWRGGAFWAMAGVAALGLLGAIVLRRGARRIADDTFCS